MPPYLSKDRSEILRLALQKLQESTSITSIGPGSVARALAEVVVNELGDFYEVMDFNTSMGLVSSASGRALDLIAQLYGVERKQLGEVATIDASVGSFYFFLDSPHVSDIVIPQGTTVTTDPNTLLGEQFSYTVTQNVTLPAGRTRVYATIRPAFTDSVFTAGANTITQHDFTAPNGVTLKCTNPKAIAPQVGYESDENLRVRIIKAVRTSAGGTAEALRFAGLAVSGVRDVRIRVTPYGLGSVEALVVPEDQSFAARVLSDTITAIEAVRPAGVRLFLREPDYTTCDVHATIIIRKDANVDSAGTARRTETAILRYLNTLLPGTKLVYTQLIQAILDASDAIADVSLTRLRISGTEILRRNYTPDEDQQIIPGDIKVATA